MKAIFNGIIITLLCIACSQNTIKKDQEVDKSIASKPPMGWNSYQSYGASVTEQEVKANTDMLAVHFKEYGWEYIVIDYCWFYPYSGALGNPPQNDDFKPALTMDKYGRLFPAVDKFPSSDAGKGFKPLADYIHSKGLKFGIHIMRGIPRQAVTLNTPVLGTNFHAKDICDEKSTCKWINSMYGIDVTKMGAKEYYKSIIDLYASWDVDYIKVDDISSPYSSDEIEAIREAIDKCGRPMVLSLSPGATPLTQAVHVKKYANLWRISDDFWDDWTALKKQFELCNSWSKYVEPGNWPDADILPLGTLNRRGPYEGLERTTHFTHEEQKTMLSLWCIFRSPLMIGADLIVLDNQTKTLLSNKEVIEVNQNSRNNHQLSHIGETVVWVAEVPDSPDKYLAIFNLGESEASVVTDLKDIDIYGECQIRDLWEQKELGQYQGTFSFRLPVHGSGLFRISIKH
jgi:alpha-galactosidase